MNLQTYIENGDIMLRWDFVAGSVNYEIYESIDDNTSYALIDTVAANVHTYNIGAPAGDHIYFYKIKALASATWSNEDFIVLSDLSYRQEMKAIIFNLLKWNSDITAIVGVNIFNKFPKQVEAYPCIIFNLDRADLPGNFQWNEMESLHVQVMSRDETEMSELNSLVNEALINFSYQGKEVVVYRIKRISDDGQTIDGDEKTFIIDNLYSMKTERTGVS